MRVAVVCAIMAGCSSSPAFELAIAAQPDTVSFRPDGGDWITVDQIAKSDRLATYEIPAQDGTIAVACTQPNGVVQVEELFATAADYQLELYSYLQPWPQLACTPLETGSGRVEITGTVDEGGQVFVGSNAFSGVGPWSFRGAVPAGVHDLVVFSLTSVLIRHDQVMVAPLDEGEIDLAADGLSVGALPLLGYVDLDNFDCSDVLDSCTTQIVTANGTTAVIGMGNGGMFYFPAEVLAPEDRQAIVLRAPGPEVQSTLAAFLDPNDPSLPGLGPPTDLEPPEGTVAFGSDDVSVDFEQARFSAPVTEYRVEYAAQGVSLAATATEGWRRAHGGRVVFDPTFPGFHWPIVPGASERTFTIRDRGAAAIVLEASIHDP